MAELKIFDINLDDYRNKLQSLRQDLADLSQGTDEYNQKQQELADTTNELSNAVASSNPSMNELRVTMQELKQEWANANDEAERGAIAEQIGLIEGQMKTMNQELKNTAQDAAAAEGSYNALVVKLRELQQAAKATGDAAERMELSQQANEINNQLKGMDAEMGNFQRNVGSYENSITSAFGQIAGAMGPVAKGAGGIGKAIGGLDAPIKMAVGALGGLSKAFKALKAAIASNPIGLLVTALTAAGVALYNHIKTVKEAEEEHKKWKKSLTDTAAKQAEYTTESMAKAEILYNAAMRAKAGSDEYKAAILALQKEYPDYFDNLSTESKDVNLLAGDYSRLATEIEKAALARASMDLYTDNFKKILQNEQRINEIDRWNRSPQSRAFGAGGNFWNDLLGSERSQDAEKRKLEEENADLRRANKNLSLNIQVPTTKGGGNRGASFGGGSHGGSSGSSKERSVPSKDEISKAVENSALIKVGGTTDVEPSDIYDFSKALDEYRKTWEKYKKTTEELSDGEKLFDKVLGAKSQEELQATTKEWDNLISYIKEGGEELPDFVKEYDDIVQNVKKAFVIDAESGDSTELIKEKIKDYEYLLKYDEADNESLATREEHYLQIVRLNEMLYDAKIKAAKAAGNEAAAEELLIEKNDYLREVQFELYNTYRKWRKEFEDTKPIITGLLPDEQNLEILDNLKAKIEENQKAVHELWKELVGVTTADILSNPERALASIKQIEEQFKQLGQTIPKQLNDKKHLAGIASTTLAIGNLTDSIASAWKNTVKAQVDAGKLTEEEAEEQFERIKQMEIAAAVVNTIAGAIGAFMQDKKAYPAPYGAIIGAIDAAATLAAGYAQIQQIKSTTIGSSGSGSSSITVANATPLLDEAQDVNQLTSLNVNGDSGTNQRVYILQSDIVETTNQNKVRVEQSTF